jgi:hypothetical protein
MTYEQRKKIESVLDEIEEAQKDAPVDNKELDDLLKSIGDKGGMNRSGLLRELHSRLSFILFMPPLILNKFIVQDLAETDLYKRGAMDIIRKFAPEPLPEDITKRIENVSLAEDKGRLIGLRRLQAFLNVRPELLYVMKALGVDTDKYPR